MRFVRPILRCLVAVLALSTISACNDTKMIPGTRIPDSDDHREILTVLERYRRAFVRLDAATILATAHRSYFDDAGTVDPGDDLSYEDLAPVLRTRLSQLESVRFTVDYLDVHVDSDRAVVKMWIDASFQMRAVQMPDGTVHRPRYTRKQDHAAIELLREGPTWRIVEGI